MCNGLEDTACNLHSQFLSDALPSLSVCNVSLIQLHNFFSITPTQLFRFYIYSAAKHVFGQDPIDFSSSPQGKSFKIETHSQNSNLRLQHLGFNKVLVFRSILKGPVNIFCTSEQHALVNIFHCSLNISSVPSFICQRHIRQPFSSRPGLQSPPTDNGKRLCTFITIIIRITIIRRLA